MLVLDGKAVCRRVIVKDLNILHLLGSQIEEIVTVCRIILVIRVRRGKKGRGVSCEQVNTFLDHRVVVHKAEVSTGDIFAVNGKGTLELLLAAGIVEDGGSDSDQHHKDAEHDECKSAAALELSFRSFIRSVFKIHGNFLP